MKKISLFLSQYLMILPFGLFAQIKMTVNRNVAIITMKSELKILTAQQEKKVSFYSCFCKMSKNPAFGTSVVSFGI